MHTHCQLYIVYYKFKQDVHGSVSNIEFTNMCYIELHIDAVTDRPVILYNWKILMNEMSIDVEYRMIDFVL